MTPAAALTATIARLSAVSGLVEARSPVGVRNESAPRINRSFSVKVEGLSPAAETSRGRSDTSGLRIAQRLRVELCHQLKPNSGQEAPSQALSDLHSVLKSISTPDTTLTRDANVDAGSVGADYAGGGAYLIQAFSLDVIYELDLTP